MRPRHPNPTPIHPTCSCAGSGCRSPWVRSPCSAPRVCSSGAGGVAAGPRLKASPRLPARDLLERVYSFQDGFHGKPNTGGPKDNPTGDIAPVRKAMCSGSCTSRLTARSKCSMICMLAITRAGEDIIMPRFTPGELKVMRLLWEHGEMKPAELQKRFPEPIKNPALRSYLTTLLEKGHVTRRLVGKAYLLQAATRSRSAFRSMLGELVDAYCGGSVQALVMNIIKSERLSEDELLELKRLADAGDPASPPPDKRSRK